MLLSPHRWPKWNLVLGFSFNAIIFTWRQVWFYWSSTNYTLCFGIWTRSHVTCSQDFSPQDTYRIFFADTQSFLGVMEWLAKKTNIHPSTDYILSKSPSTWRSLKQIQPLGEHKFGQSGVSWILYWEQHVLLGATNLEQDNFNLSKMRKLLLKFAHNSAETIMGPTLLEFALFSVCVT